MTAYFYRVLQKFLFPRYLSQLQSSPVSMEVTSTTERERVCSFLSQIAVALLPYQTVRCVVSHSPQRRFTAVYSCACYVRSGIFCLRKVATCSWCYWILGKLLGNGWKLKTAFGENSTDSGGAFIAHWLKRGNWECWRRPCSRGRILTADRQTDRAPFARHVVQNFSIKSTGGLRT